jgi:carbon-monoxide dehydrogenase large subunit
MMDILANELGMSRVEVRRKNFPTEFPFTTAIGLMYDSGDYHKTLDRLMELSDSKDTFERRRQEARARGKLLGRGLSTWVEVCGFVPSDVARHALGITPGGWESATVRVHPTGKATVITGTSPHGQGHATSWSQIVETELGIPFDDIEVIHGDTAFAPYGLGTYGSRSLAVGGIAAYKAGEKIIAKARKLAAHQLECAEDDLEWTPGTFTVRGTDRSVDIKTLAFTAWSAHDLPEGFEPGLVATHIYDPPNFSWPHGAHACVVEVDTETGSVDIVRYIAVDDCGVVINPLVVEGQVHGGVAQGIAEALFEEAAYDEDGNLVTGTMTNYMVPGAPELPPFELDRTVTPSPTNPLGVKGIGEAGTIAAPPAVIGAVVDALSHLGVVDVERPATPERVWRAIQEARR